jgi:hypothetical protein
MKGRECMSASELKALNDLLEKECGWLVELAVSPVGGEEFFRVYEAFPDHTPADADGPNPEPSRGAFVGVMPMCTTPGAFLSSGSLCQYYYQKGLSARDNALT